MVNNVSGFIGPEILYDGKQMIRANLEDLCMGKLAELPMGMAPCYTTHAEIVRTTTRSPPCCSRSAAQPTSWASPRTMT